jgi:hypothetical protein
MTFIDLQKKVSNKQEEVSGKENELTNISQSRQNLVTLGEALSGDVGHVISIVSTAWKNCHNDAIAIKRWLDDGKQDADLPMYMACDLGHADGLCTCNLFYTLFRELVVDRSHRFRRWQLSSQVRGFLGRYVR